MSKEKKPANYHLVDSNQPHNQLVSRRQANAHQVLINILIISAGCNWSGYIMTHYQFSRAHMVCKYVTSTYDAGLV